MNQKPATRYPWGKWLKRRKRRLHLVWHKDFACMPHSMSVQIRNAAIQRGFRVSVQIESNGTLIVERKD